MNQDDINQSEWTNPKNWGALTYRSRQDSRLIVPKRRGIGWTINFGQPRAVVLFIALLALPPVIVLVALLGGAQAGRH